MMMMMATRTTMSDQAELEFSLMRARVERLLALLDVKRDNGGLDVDETKAREVAEIRLFGAGASPKKFARLEAQQVDGVLRDQYRFSGGFQTGRMSSKAAQIQNLTRDVLGEDGAAEAPLVDAIADGCSYAALAAASPADVPVARKLALLVRPAIIASAARIFVWSDWSAIEARITAWLANSPDAERVLDIFRANDRDPLRPDVYTIAAANILHKESSAIVKPERQIGKVATLKPWLRRLRRRAAGDGAELSHSPRRCRSASRRRCLARRESVGARILECVVGRRDASVGAARQHYHRRPRGLRFSRGLSWWLPFYGAAIRSLAHLSTAKVARRRGV